MKLKFKNKNKNRKEPNAGFEIFEPFKSSFKEEEIRLVKPDGGYGYVVVAVGFLISFFLDGGMYSFGILLNEMRKHFNVSQDIANLVVSFNFGFLYLTGPLAAALCKYFGCRIVIMVSAVTFGLAFVTSAYVPNIYYIIIIFGVIGGISFGCCYLSAFIILEEYFDEKFGLANGLVMSGFFAFPPFVEFINRELGWKISMIILGSLNLQCCVLGALLKPVKLKRVKVEKKAIEMTHLDDGEKGEEIDSDQVKSETEISRKENFIISLIKETFNFKILFKDHIFFLFSMSNLLIFIFYLVPFIYIPIRAEQLKITQYAWLISIIGIINIPGRVMFGIASDRNILHALLMFSISCYLASLACFIYYFLETFWSQLAFATIFGVACAGINSLTSPSLLKIVGSEKFPNAYGIVNVFLGIGSWVGPYIAGFISDKTNIFVTFTFTSAFIFSAGIVSTIAFIILHKNPRNFSKN